MKEAAVLRVPRTDDEDAYVLVQVVSSGRKGLDFDLAATEGAHPYLVTCTYAVHSATPLIGTSVLPSGWRWTPSRGLDDVLCILQDMLVPSHAN